MSPFMCGLWAAFPPEQPPSWAAKPTLSMWPFTGNVGGPDLVKGHHQTDPGHAVRHFPLECPWLHRTRQRLGHLGETAIFSDKRPTIADSPFPSCFLSWMGTYKQEWLQTTWEYGRRAKNTLKTLNLTPFIRWRRAEHSLPGERRCPLFKHRCWT